MQFNLLDCFLEGISFDEFIKKSKELNCYNHDNFYDSVIIKLNCQEIIVDLIHLCMDLSTKIPEGANNIEIRIKGSNTVLKLNIKNFIVALSEIDIAEIYNNENYVKLKRYYYEYEYLIFCKVPFYIILDESTAALFSLYRIIT